MEDNEEWRTIVMLILKRLGYEVLEAHTGLEAISQAITGLPDLILMDLSLPKMSGNEATAYLKIHPSTRHIPIVVQTAHTNEDMKHHVLEAGASEILYKPIGVDELRAVLTKYLSNEKPPVTRRATDWFEVTKH